MELTQFEQIKEMTSTLKKLGVLDRKEEKKIRSRASNLLDKAKRESLVEGAFA